MLPVECDVGAVASMLVDAGLLPEWDAENRQAVAAAYSRVTRALSDIDPDRLAVLLRHA